MRACVADEHLNRAARQRLLQRGAAGSDWVLVHDAARCLITPALINRLIDACLNAASADEEGGLSGALLAMPLPDTLKTADAAGRAAATLPREGKWLAQTPQMFRIAPLHAALAARAASGFAGITDEASAMEAVGSRPLLVEIQALVDDAHGFTPKRLTVGLEQNRLAMLLAVLNRHAGIACFDQDVFINAVGGVKISEPAADLAVILAMVSSFRNKPLPEKMVAFGEVGLSGEVRPVARGQERLKEAEKLGFKRAIVPKANLPRSKKEFPGLEIFGVERLDEAVRLCRDLAD